MTNTTRKRGRYIIKTNPPSGTDHIEYDIHINGSEVLIFHGFCRYFGGTFDIDCEDWIDEFSAKQINDGLTALYCDVRADVHFYDINNVDTPMTYHLVSTPDTIDVDQPAKTGIFSAKAKGANVALNNEYGFPSIVAIYPLFYFNLSGMYSGTGVRPLLNVKTVVDPNMWTNLSSLPSGSSSRFRYSAVSSRMDIEEDEYLATVKDDFVNHTIKNTDYLFNRMNYSDLVQHPRLFIANGLNSLTAQLDTNIPNPKSIPAIRYYEFGDHEDTADLNDFFFSFTEEELMDYFDKYIDTYTAGIDGSVLETSNGRISVEDFTLSGIGYKVITLYGRTQGTSFLNDFGVYSEEFIYAGNINDECHTANIVLEDCGYVIGNGTLINDLAENNNLQPVQYNEGVSVKLRTGNGMLSGQTNNNVVKTTYIDRYGDEHNASTNNKYELTCYVDDEWLRTISGQDTSYMKVMNALQSAKRSYLATTAKISGMDGDERVMECHIKNVEAITTNATYSSSTPIPTLKITIEIYK